MAARSNPTGRPTSAETGERRGHQRVNVSIPFSTQLDGRLVRIETDNISEGGAYCRSEAKFPVMTRLDVVLELPGEAVPSKGDDLVQLTAVVVRCDPQPGAAASWNLALFFPMPDADVREKLARYVRSRRTIDSPAY